MPLQLLQRSYVNDLVKCLKRNPYLRNQCRYGDRPPTETNFTQMKRRIGSEGFCMIEALRELGDTEDCVIEIRESLLGALSI